MPRHLEGVLVKGAHSHSWQQLVQIVCLFKTHIFWLMHLGASSTALHMCCAITCAKSDQGMGGQCWHAVITHPGKKRVLTHGSQGQLQTWQTCQNLARLSRVVCSLLRQEHKVVGSWAVVCCQSSLQVSASVAVYYSLNPAKTGAKPWRPAQNPPHLH